LRTKRRKIPLSSSIILAKAKRLFEHFKGQRSEESLQSCGFQASKGWFDKLKNRHSLHNVKPVGESSTADHEAAQRFPEELRKLIEEKGYVPQQVFTADDTGLFWKTKCLKERFFRKWNGLPPAIKQQRIVYPLSSVLMLRELA
jgi:hypothetical protein